MTRSSPLRCLIRTLQERLEWNGGQSFSLGPAGR